MPTKIHYGAMHRVYVTTIDKYDHSKTYEFKNEGGVVKPKDGYTLTVLQALWDEGIPVDWSLDELHPNEREEFKENNAVEA